MRLPWVREVGKLDMTKIKNRNAYFTKPKLYVQLSFFIYLKCTYFLFRRNFKGLQTFVGCSTQYN